MDNYIYDVAMSYASENEKYVSRVSKILEKMYGLKIFFSPDKKEKFFAEDMILKFQDIYGSQAMYVAIFVSKEYLQKDITMHEASTVLMRLKHEEYNCIIPISLGGNRLDELDADIHYTNGDITKEVELAYYISEKVNMRKKTLYINNTNVRKEDASVNKDKKINIVNIGNEKVINVAGDFKGDIKF